MEIKKSIEIELRKKAELIARKKVPQPQEIEALSAEEIRRMLHELKARQIELEIENDDLRSVQALAQRIIESSPTSFYSLDRDYCYTSFNQAHAREMKQLYGTDIELGGRLIDYQAAERDRSKSKANFDRALGGEQFAEEAYTTGQAASGMHVEITYHPICDENDRVTGMFVFTQDITKRKQVEKALKDQLKFEKLVSDISARFMRLPSKRMDEGINHALKKTGELFGFDCSYLFLFSDDMQTVRITHEWVTKGVEAREEKRHIFRTDTLPWLAWRIKTEDYVHIPDVNKLPPEASAEKAAFESQDIGSLLCVSLIKNGSVFGFLGFGAEKEKEWTQNYAVLLKVIAELISNALARGMADERIRHLSFYDQLTGLYNRLYLEEEMQRLDTERQLPISIIMSDLNGLKLINDTYGHAVGDEMLKCAARILTRSCRKEDIIARWGGDEFMILLPRAAETETNAICRRINEICKGTYVEDVPVSMALGVAVKDHPNVSLEGILKQADDMMYKQKLAESRSTKNAVLNALLKTLTEKSFETKEHAQRMRDMALKIGEKLNLSFSELNRLSLLVTLHDIGKIKLPEEILIKRGPLTSEEWQIVKRHPETGYRIACATEEFAHVAHDILCHHEHYDGKGYPRGLKGKETPLLAGITSIADAWEVMSHGRPYKAALSPEEIANEFKRCAGTQFDPELVDVFLSVLKEEEFVYPTDLKI